MQIVRWTAGTLAALALFAPLAAAAKPESNKKKAIYAIKREIARKYPLLDAIYNGTNTHDTVTCEVVSKTRFTCEWSATNNVHEEATGKCPSCCLQQGHSGDPL
jgi:hypothetical protein